MTPAKTAELLAQFVASRTQPPSSNSSSSTTKVEPKKEDINTNKKHTPLPKATEDLTQPIMYIDKKTGVLSVDMMWTCTKCSYAYNKVEDTKCEVCRVKRVTTPKEEMAGPDGDFQLLTQVKTVLLFSQLRWELDLLPHRDLRIVTISETKPQ